MTKLERASKIVDPLREWIYPAQQARVTQEIAEALAALERETWTAAARSCQVQGTHYEKEDDMGASRGAFQCAQNLYAAATTAEGTQDG
jgi:hypothetical protein